MRWSNDGNIIDIEDDVKALSAPMTNKGAEKGSEAVAGCFSSEDWNAESEIVPFIRDAVKVLVTVSEAVFW